jgi:sulfite exporter TauE/SafE
VIGWLMIFAGGLLGSSHCVGMCGGFALALGTRGQGCRAILRRQLVYSLGRVFTYTVFGAAAGYAGWRLTAELRTLVNLQAVLSIATGVALMLLGLAEAGVLRWCKPTAGLSSCLGPAFFAALLSATRIRSLFLAGLVNGLLPCGLVYAFLAVAASTADLWRGAATMTVFGLGTLPVMILVGLGGPLLNLASRRRITTFAAWCVLLTGVLTIVRGLGFVQLPGLLDSPGCPACQ